jgi:predicted TIM-barrel fold metal-dependent hydrolase
MNPVGTADIIQESGASAPVGGRASWIIDADSHVTEPPDLWVSRVATKHRGEVPRVVATDVGEEIWTIGGVRVATVGQSASGAWPDFPTTRPKTLRECHPGAYDAAARLAYLDEVGIWAQVLFPNVGGFGAQKFLFLEDASLKLACVRAYNDYLAEWASADARRLLAVLATPFWDVRATVAEIERCADRGFRGVLFTGEPMRFGLPTLGDRSWDPVWSAAQECGLPIHFHVGGGEDTAGFHHPERLRAHGIGGATAFCAVDLFMKNGAQCADLISSGVLPRFPALQFVSVESGIGWIPFVLEAADYHFLGATRSGRIRSGELLPSELFRRQVYATYWFERVAPRALLQDLPIDNILFETDFPHPSCLYGNVRETIERGLVDAPAAVAHRFVWANAASLYGIEPPDDVWSPGRP